MTNFLCLFQKHFSPWQKNRCQMLWCPFGAYFRQKWLLCKATRI